MLLFILEVVVVVLEVSYNEVVVKFHLFYHISSLDFSTLLWVKQVFMGWKAIIFLSSYFMYAIF